MLSHSLSQVVELDKTRSSVKLPQRTGGRWRSCGSRCVREDNSITSGVRFQAALRMLFNTLNSLLACIKITELLEESKHHKHAFQTEIGLGWCHKYLRGRCCKGKPQISSNLYVSYAPFLCYVSHSRMYPDFHDGGGFTFLWDICQARDLFEIYFERFTLTCHVVLLPILLLFVLLWLSWLVSPVPD